MSTPTTDTGEARTIADASLPLPPAMFEHRIAFAQVGRDPGNEQRRSVELRRLTDKARAVLLSFRVVEVLVRRAVRTFHRRMVTRRLRAPVRRSEAR